jgi:hypothetical protein
MSAARLKKAEEMAKAKFLDEGEVLLSCSWHEVHADDLLMPNKSRLDCAVVATVCRGGGSVLNSCCSCPQVATC